MPSYVRWLLVHLHYAGIVLLAVAVFIVFAVDIWRYVMMRLGS
jgi:hypothetical protein